jgi:large subunit ribosomal protein L5
MASEEKEKKSASQKPHDKAHEKQPRGPQQGGGEKKARKPKGPAPEAAVEAGPEEPQQPAPIPRLITRYREQIVPALRHTLGRDNALAVPRLEKIVVSMGVGKFATAGSEGKGKLEQAEKELSVIVGQKPLRCKAKKSVANFKVREGMDTGLKVTLRGRRMYEFLDRVISLAIPRVKDFRGLDPTGFDKSGNFNFGFSEQTVFPEVSVETLAFQQGMNITVVTTAHDAAQGRELLKLFGLPFREDAKESKEPRGHTESQPSDAKHSESKTSEAKPAPAQA